MRRITGWRGWSLTLLVGVTGAWLVAQPAAAQPPCLEPDEAVDETLEFLVERLEHTFGLDLNDADLCEALTQNFIKTCSAAVKESVKCLQIQFAGWSRQDQIACKALLTGDAAKECATEAKDLLKAYQNQFKLASAEAIDACQNAFADEYFDVCLSGP